MSSTSYFRDACSPLGSTVDTCIFENLLTNFSHIFYVAGNSNPEAFFLALSMLLVAVSLSAARTLESAHYFSESSISWQFAAVFCCSVQLEPSMMKSSSSSRASCILVSATVAALVSCDHTQSSIVSQTTTNNQQPTTNNQQQQ